MNRNFEFNPAGAPEPIYFEQIIAEKPGGGLLANQDFDVKKSEAVGLNASGLYAPIKAYRLVEAATAESTTIKIAKGSGIKKGDVIATGKIGVACTNVDTTTSDDYDVVTVSLGIAISVGKVLYQAKEASVQAGYYDAKSTTTGKLTVVANDAQSVAEGEIKLEDVTPYQGTKSPLAVGDYVILKQQLDAEPIYTPKYVSGTNVDANKGDYEIRLINHANLRKETALIADEVLELLPGIALV